MQEIILETRDLTKTFTGEVKAEALKKINIKISKGEFCSITGPSGSGKSTLLHLLAALDLPSTGEVLINSQSTSKMNEDQLTELRGKNIGLVFQFHFLLPEFSALENLIIPQLFLIKDQQLAEKNALVLLEQVNLLHKKNNKPAQMSGGEQQRVAIARALINKPLILLADEPTGNLDSENSRKIYQLFRELNQKFRQTTIIVTHDLNFATSTDRKIELVDGQIFSDSFNS